MLDPHEIIHSELADRYTLEGELGRGGMATVFLARDRKHDRRVALKVIHPELVHGIGPKRFEREIRITSSLQHPHIVPLLDSGVAGDLPYYVAPYIEGESLRDRLRRGRLSIDEALRFASDVASALDYAHRIGIVHRDVKPANILISDGQAIVADFGIARAISGSDETTLTATGTTVGTLAYMSPEQVTGKKDLDGRADLYSLACVLYETIAGRPPFVPSTSENLLKSHMFETPAALTTLRPEVPKSVERAVSQALEKLPENRQRSVADFASALEGAEEGVTLASLLWNRALAVLPNRFFIAVVGVLIVVEALALARGCAA